MLALTAGSVDARLMPFLALVGSLPTLYWAVLAERYLQAMKQRGPLMRANLVVGGVALATAFLVKTIDQAVIFYAIGLSVYAGWLIFLCRRQVNLPAAVLVIGVAPLAVELQPDSVIYPAAYFVGMLLLAWSVFKPGLADLGRMRGHP